METGGNRGRVGWYSVYGIGDVYVYIFYWECYMGVIYYTGIL